MIYLFDQKKISKKNGVLLKAGRTIYYQCPGCGQVVACKNSPTRLIHYIPTQG